MNRRTELSPNLAWMLANRQVSDRALLDPLFDGHYPALFRLALTVLGNPSQAAAATIETLIQAIQTRHRYQASEDVQCWLFRLAVSICRRRKFGSAESLLASAFENVDLADELYAALVPNPASLASGHAREFWGVFQSINDRYRIPALLTWLHGVPLEDVAKIMGETENRTRRNLEEVHGFLSGSQSLQSPTNLSPEDLLGEIWDHHLTAIPLDHGHRSVMISYILAEARRRGQRQHIGKGIREIMFAAVIIALVVGVMRTSDWLTPQLGAADPGAPVKTKIVVVKVTATPELDAIEIKPIAQSITGGLYYEAQVGDTLQRIAEKVRIPLDQLVAINRIERDASLPAGQLVVISPYRYPAQSIRLVPQDRRVPLSQTSSIQEVEGRMMESDHFWHSVWASVQIETHGKPGENNQAQVRRAEVWISLPSKGMLIRDVAPDQQNQSWLSVDGREYIVDQDTGKPIFMGYTDPDFPLNAALRAMFFPEELLRLGALTHVVDSQVVAGREALLVEWSADDDLSKARLWVDQQTGIILHMRIVTRQDTSWISRRFSVLSIVAD